MKTKNAIKWRLVLILACAATVGVAGVELQHYVRFHDFFGYGWHADLIAHRVDIGIPGVNTTYAVWLSNFTIHSQIFEGVRLSGGYIGSGVFYKSDIQRWAPISDSWITVSSTTTSDWHGYPFVSRKIWPTQSFFAAGWDAVGATEGLNQGDKVRIAIYSSFDGVRTRIFYSPEFIIRDHRK